MCLSCTSAGNGERQAMPSYTDEMYSAYLTAITNAGRREVIKWERLGNVVSGTNLGQSEAVSLAP